MRTRYCGYRSNRVVDTLLTPLTDYALGANLAPRGMPLFSLFTCPYIRTTCKYYATWSMYKHNRPIPCEHVGTEPIDSHRRQGVRLLTRHVGWTQVPDREAGGAGLQRCLAQSCLVQSAEEDGVSYPCTADTAVAFPISVCLSGCSAPKSRAMLDTA